MEQQKNMRKLFATVIGLSLMSTSVFAETSWYNDINNVNNAGYNLSDTAVSAKIREALLPIQDIDSEALSIRTEFGHVFISGFVNNKEQETQVIQIIEKINGVKGVDASLNIK